MSILRGHSLGAVSVTLAMVLTSCAQTESGAPTISSRTDRGIPSASTSADSSTAIKDPIDTTHLLKQPCSALADDDLVALGLIEGRVDDDTINSAVHACVWERADDSGGRTDLIVVTENANGLEGIRQQNLDSELLAETQIGDYPALHASVFDRRDKGECDLWIGVNDSEALFIFVSLEELADPCGYADRVGEAVITNLTL